MTQPRTPRALVLALPFVGALGVLVGCGGSLALETVKPEAIAMPAPRADLPTLRAAVYDFTDRTGGENGVRFESGKRYTNLPRATGDVAAGAVRRIGWFQDVERRVERWAPAAPAPGSAASAADIVVTGDVEVFEVGGAPHFTVWFNPICLPALFGVPTGYGKLGWEGRIRVRMLDGADAAALDDFVVALPHREVWIWASIYDSMNSFRDGGQNLLVDFNKAMMRDLDKHLGVAVEKLRAKKPRS